MTHDYKRNGTTTLFTALDVKTGLVIGECHPRHRAKEFIRFLNRIDRCLQRHLDIHLGFHLHFTPNTGSISSSASFLRSPKSAFAAAHSRAWAISRTPVHDYLDRHNADPKPFVWTKTAEAVLEKARRALNSLEAIKAGNQPSESEH